MAQRPTHPTDLADYLLATDLRLRALTERLWRQQHRLKGAVAPEVFSLYLDIEDTANERLLARVEGIWEFARAEERRRRRTKRARGE